MGRERSRASILKSRQQAEVVAQVILAVPFHHYNYYH